MGVVSEGKVRGRLPNHRHSLVVQNLRVNMCPWANRTGRKKERCKSRQTEERLVGWVRTIAGKMSSCSAGQQEGVARDTHLQRRLASPSEGENGCTCLIGNEYKECTSQCIGTCIDAYISQVQNRLGVQRVSN